MLVWGSSSHTTCKHSHLRGWGTNLFRSCYKPDHLMLDSSVQRMAPQKVPDLSKYLAALFVFPQQGPVTVSV